MQLLAVMLFEAAPALRAMTSLAARNSLKPQGLTDSADQDGSNGEISLPSAFSVGKTAVLEDAFRFANSAGAAGARAGGFRSFHGGFLTNHSLKDFEVVVNLGRG